jgi:hypothetical protein
MDVRSGQWPCNGASPEAAGTILESLTALPITIDPLDADGVFHLSELALKTS